MKHLALLFIALFLLEAAQAQVYRRGGAYPDSMKFYYEMDDANDAHGIGCGGSGCNLSTVNTPSFVSGKVGNDADFDSGEPDYFQITSEFDDLDLQGDTPFSIGLWYNPDVLSGQMTLVYKGTGAANNTEYSCGTSGTAVEFFLGTGSANTSHTSGTLSTGTWYHIVCTHDPDGGTGGNGELCIQIDDAAPDCTDYTGGTHDSGGDFAICSVFGLGANCDGTLGGIFFTNGAIVTPQYAACHRNADRGLGYQAFINCKK